MNWRIFEQALLDYNKPEINRIVEQFELMENGLDFIDDFIVKALSSIGDKWERSEVALSQVYMSSRVCEEIVLNYLSKQRLEPKKELAVSIITLEEYHTLGKRIVGAVIRSSGFDLIDYGTVLEPEEIYKRVSIDSVDVLIISVLMYPSALKVEKITTLLRQMSPNLKILVGGAPFLMDDQLYKIVGAHAMGKSATDSVRLLKDWTGEVSK